MTDGRALETAAATRSSGAGGSGVDLRVRLLRDTIHRALAAGVDWIQIREKDLDSRALLELARFAVAEAQSMSAKILINDRLDVALAASAAGVHLGEQSLPVAQVNEWRRSAGRMDFQIGVSCHSLDSAHEAERGGADYVFFGPVFATPSKTSFGAPQGTHRLREVCEAIQVPVVAIGGITPENARECMDSGAAGVAAIRFFQDAKDLAELAEAMQSVRSVGVRRIAVPRAPSPGKEPAS